MRRTLILSCAVALSTTLTPAVANEVAPWDIPAATGFAYGVASGDIGHRSVRLWARPGAPGQATLQVATDRAFQKIVTTRQLASVEERDFTVQTRITGLKPGMRYYYRFLLGDQSSDVGLFHTAPKRSSKKPVSFAFSGDAQATPDPATGKPFFNDFQAFDAMTAEKNTFNVLLGDTIYSDTQVGAVIEGVELVSPWTARTVAEKRAVYRQNLALAPMARFRGATSLYTHWDDHEFINNFTRPDDGDELFNAGREAFIDYTPLPEYSPETGYYRTQRWGENLQVYFLDQISFRTKMAEEECYNPILKAPDLAPTLPPAFRKLQTTLLPSMAWKVSQQCLDTLESPDRHVLGKAQVKRFLADLKSSDATFKVVMVQGPMQQIVTNAYDRMESYAHERARLLRAMKRIAPKNVIFLTTDVHANFIGDVRVRTFGEGGPTKNLYKEVTTGPIAATTHKQQLIQGSGRPQTADVVRNLFYTAAVDPKGRLGGLGMTCANLNTYSYGQVDVTADRLTVTLKDLNGKRVLSEGGPKAPVGKPCPQVVLKK